MSAQSTAMIVDFLISASPNVQSVAFYSQDLAIRTIIYPGWKFCWFVFGLVCSV